MKAPPALTYDELLCYARMLLEENTDLRVHASMATTLATQSCCDDIMSYSRDPKEATRLVGIIRRRAILQPVAPEG